jgi:hypothetical protein
MSPPRQPQNSTPLSWALTSGWLEGAFPGSRSIEIFGAPGAGKSFFCSRLAQTSEIRSTSENDVLNQFAMEQMLGFPRILDRILGRRVMKNYYKLQIDHCCERFWQSAPQQFSSFLDAVTSSVQLADVPPRTERNVTKSVRINGLALAMARENNERIVVDEGFVRKLVTLLVQSQTTGAPASLLSPLKTCLERYPWDRNAIFIDAPTDVCIKRQDKRGHVVHGPTKEQTDQRTAAGDVYRRCVDSGWTVVKIWNDAYLNP